MKYYSPQHYQRFNNLEVKKVKKQNIKLILLTLVLLGSWAYVCTLKVNQVHKAVCHATYEQGYSGTYCQ